MKVINTLYLVTFLFSGALAVPMTDDVIDSDKRDISTENFQLSGANQPGAGNVPDIRSLLDRDVNDESEFAEASEVEARNAKKKKNKGKKCGKNGKKCAKRGKKGSKKRKHNRKGKKKAKKATAY